MSRKKETIVFLEHQTFLAHQKYSQLYTLSATKNIDEEPELKAAFDAYWAAHERAGCELTREIVIGFPPELGVECGLGGFALPIGRLLSLLAQDHEANSNERMADFYRYISNKYYPVDSSELPAEETIPLEDMEAVILEKQSRERQLEEATRRKKRIVRH